MRKTLSYVLGSLFVLCGLGLSPGAATPGETAVHGEPSLPVLHPGERHLLLLMIDGLPVGPFEEALAAHELPHLERLFAERPTLRTRALSTFPSATSPSVPELLSGRWVELEGLPAPAAVHAFDRERRRIVRYLTEPDTWDWPIPNLFGAAAQAGLPALSVFEGRWKGAGSILTTAAIARSAALEVLGAHELAGDRKPVEALLAQIEREGAPRVTLVVFNEVDLKGHFHGPASREVHHALVETDVLIGEILDALRQEKAPGGRSVLDDTTVLLFGDHGMAPSGRFVDLAAFFRQRGLVAYDASTVSHVLLRERLGSVWTRWPDAILVAGGSNITQIYLRSSGGGWLDGSDAVPEEIERARRRPDIDDLARQLAEHPGVSQVLRQVAPGEIELRAAGEQTARVIERGEGRDRRWAYVVPDGAADDPLGYLGDPDVAPLVSRNGSLSDAGFFDVETWIERTRNARYPAAVPLVQRAFHPQRFTGDLMVTARLGWTFLRGQHGDHGNLEREAMITPLVLNGAGVDEGTLLPLARLVDIYPTAAVLLGADPNDPALSDLDGRVLPGIRPPARR
ncbi:MAG TPA: alkaline phosphatase family protein [Thermoanaerobaculia bacterium]|nr:alkaline phosphatase family protein [Thermoanaerobaculia bacterium]